MECTVVYCSSLFCHSLHELILDQLIILLLIHYDMSLFLLFSLPSMVENINLRRHRVPNGILQVSVKYVFAQFLTTTAQ